MKPVRYMAEFLFYATAMVLAWAMFLDSNPPVQGLTVSAPAAPAWCGYELFMASGLPATNWVDLCGVTGTNGVTASPAGQQPTFFRAQYNNLTVPLVWDSALGDGYKVYCGTPGGVFTQCVDVGTNTFWLLAVSNMAPVLEFAVTAYATIGGNYIETDPNDCTCLWTNKLTLVIQ